MHKFVQGRVLGEILDWLSNSNNVCLIQKTVKLFLVLTCSQLKLVLTLLPPPPPKKKKSFWLKAGRNSSDAGHQCLYNST